MIKRVPFVNLRRVINASALLKPLLFFCLSSCTNLFFFPTKDLAVTPDTLGLEYNELELRHTNNTKIRGWKLAAQGKPKGTILFFHGNAQNISYHIESVYWLPKAGFNVILMDYQGYGPSDGSSSVKSAIADIRLSLLEFQSETRPLILYGQSIGASLSVAALTSLKPETKIDGVILESPFASYQQIAREKLRSLWLTWPLQYPLSLLISDEYAPDKFIATLPKMPILMIVSKVDQVVLPHHTLDLFKKAHQPKELWEYESYPHIGIFQNDATQARLVRYLEGIQ